MKAEICVLQLTYSKVIEIFSEMSKIPIREAMDIFYKSQTYQEMRQGISDMHCRSDKYLAEELLLENHNKSQYEQTG